MITTFHSIRIHRFRVLFGVACPMMLAGCIASVPNIDKLEETTQAESLYQVEPWAAKPPVNLIRGFAVAINTLDSIQGTVQASFDYQNQQVAEYNRIVNDLHDTRVRVYAEQRARHAEEAVAQAARENAAAAPRSLQDEIDPNASVLTLNYSRSNWFTQEEMTQMLQSVMGISGGWADHSRRQMFRATGSSSSGGTQYTSPSYGDQRVKPPSSTDR